MTFSQKIPFITQRWPGIKFQFFFCNFLIEAPNRPSAWQNGKPQPPLFFLFSLKILLKFSFICLMTSELRETKKNYIFISLLDEKVFNFRWHNEKFLLVLQFYIFVYVSLLFLSTSSHAYVIARIVISQQQFCSHFFWCSTLFKTIQQHEADVPFLFAL